MFNKITLTMFCFACIIFQAKAQFSILEDTLKADGSATESDLFGHTKFKNNKNIADTFVWQRTENTLSSGSWYSAVCDINLCYGTSVNNAEFILGANDSGEISFHFYPNNTKGTGKMTVRFSRKSDPSSYIDVVTTSNAWGLNINTISNQIVKISPNPSKDFFVLNTNMMNNGKLEIFNLEGKLLSQINNYAGEKVDITSLNSGLYLVTYTDNQHTVSSKLIVE